MGIHESSGKALKIMVATTVMAVVILVWCGVTLARARAGQSLPLAPDLRPKIEYRGGRRQGPRHRRRAAMWQRDPATGKFVPQMEPDGQGAIRTKPKINEATGRQEDPLGLISRCVPGPGRQAPPAGHWWSIVGLIGLLVAFGHSILAMSGEETLAQVYREVESPEAAELQEGGLYRLRLQPGADGRHLLPRRAADPRRGPHEGLLATT